MTGERLTQLHEDYASNRTAEGCEILVEHYRPMASSLARRMARRLGDREDVSQVAMMGLLKALNRFEPDRGVSFATFAWRTIEGEIKRFFRDSSWAMHVPRSLQERSAMVSVAAEDLAHELGHAPTISAIASRVNLADEEVVEVLELQRVSKPLSIDIDESDDEGSRTVLLADEDAGFVLSEDRHVLTELIAGLPERERLVLQLRFSEQLTQTAIAERVGVSQMHVSRMLARSLARLRERVAHGHD